MRAIMRKRGPLLIAEWNTAKEALDRYRDGDEVSVQIYKPRSVKQNRLWHAGMRRAFESLPERLDNLITSQDALEDAVKIAAGHCRMTLNVETGEFVAVPLSTAFDEMDAAAFNAFLDRAMTSLHQHVFPEMAFDEMRRWLFRPRDEA